MSKEIFKGLWKIIEMETWDVEPGGSIQLDVKGNGSLHFLCVHAEIDYRINPKTPERAEFSFYGNDEGDEVHGRGWVKLDNGGKHLVGQLIFHQGDESMFQATRK